MYVIKYASVEPVWNFGTLLNYPPSYYRSFNYRRTFRTNDLDKAFQQLDQVTALRVYGARAVVQQVWRVDGGKAIRIVDEQPEPEREA